MSGVQARTRIRLKDGSLINITASGTSQTEAEAALRHRARDAWGGIARSITADTTIAELADAWLQDARRRGKVESTTIHAYEATVRTIIKPNMGAYTIEQMDAGLCDQELLNLSVTSASKARKARSALRLMFKLAIRHRAIPQNPIDAVETTPAPQPVKSSVDDKQLSVLIRELEAWEGKNPGRRGGIRPDRRLLSDLLLLMLATSERIGEIVLLSLRDIVIHDGRIYVTVWDTVRQIPGVGLVRKGAPKRSDQRRQIPLPPFAEEIVRRRMAAYVPNAEEFLFPTRNGTAHSPANFRRLLRAFRDDRRQALEAAQIDVDRLTPKTMRKSAATAVEESLSLSDAQLLLGHAHPGTTSVSYVQRSKIVPSRTADALAMAFPSAASDPSGDESESDEQPPQS
ncbi:tyrosine-type recombinase/integrase [Microbacterium oleivorans]|uniref:tyrosine-type recombinase/integrase n=1 Tax=Microbacterium oleivorans TaxID=273677 RepID=UPI00203D98FC|nr:site-specific integrase [Microbacterium oleivorans]MCM3696324.1 site-specific integrase [Microbacterium oleivorans]